MDFYYENDIVRRSAEKRKKTKTKRTKKKTGNQKKKLKRDAEVGMKMKWNTPHKKKEERRKQTRVKYFSVDPEAHPSLESCS